MKTISTYVFEYDELEDEAKGAARDWYRMADDFSFHAATVMEDAEAIGLLMGIHIEKIHYSGFYSQGDGACFDGEYQYAKDSMKLVKNYAPTDTKLHRIAEELAGIQKTRFYKLSASIRQQGSYQNSGPTYITVVDNNTGKELEYSDSYYKDLKAALRSFMDWIYAQLKDEYEYQNSDEAVEENIRANGYTFTKNGARFWRSITKEA